MNISGKYNVPMHGFTAMYQNQILKDKGYFHTDLCNVIRLVDVNKADHLTIS